MPHSYSDFCGWEPSLQPTHSSRLLFFSFLPPTYYFSLYSVPQCPDLLWGNHLPLALALGIDPILNSRGELRLASASPTCPVPRHVIQFEQRIPKALVRGLGWCFLILPSRSCWRKGLVLLLDAVLWGREVRIGVSLLASSKRASWGWRWHAKDRENQGWLPDDVTLWKKP